MTPEIVIAGGARTAMAEYVGRFKDVSAIELGAVAARGALERSRVAPGDVDHVFFGNALQTSADAAYGARHVALRPRKGKRYLRLRLWLLTHADRRASARGGGAV